MRASSSWYGEAWAQPDPGWEEFASAGSVIYAGTYYPNQGPANAFDGVGTYYSGTAASLPHVGVDAVLPRILRYIEARGTASFSFAGRVRFSDDGVTFTDTATTVSVPANDGTWHQFPVPDYGAHRYWVIADLQDDTYFQIDELRMYAPPAGTPPPSDLEDVTSVGNFIVGGANYPGQGASNAFNAPGLWYSGTTSSGTYVGRDFGTPRELRRIDATGTSSFSFYGRVRYSDDGVTFFDTAATIYVGPGTSAPVSTLIPEVYGAHRYWVIADLQDDGYLQIDELQLFAVPAAPPPSQGELQDVTDVGTLVSGGTNYPAQGPENAFNSPGAWYSGTSAVETYVGRDLITPRTLRRIDVTGTASFSFYGSVKYSDDGATWTNTSTTIDVPPGISTLRSFSIQDYGTHRYWAIFDLQDDGYLQVDEIRLFASVPAVPTSLQVSGTTPAPLATGVRYAPISATFNVDVNVVTLTDSTVRLETLTGNLVASTRVYDSATRTVTLTPVVGLTPLTTYRIRIVGGISGVASTVPTTMVSDFIWAFSTAAPNGLAGAWAFADGTGTTTIDASGNGNTGTVVGAAWASGALSFDGVDDRVQIADADTLDITARITIAAWVRLASLKGESAIFVKKSATNGYSYSLWTTESNKVAARFVLNGTPYLVEAPNALPLNTSKYVAATYDGSLIQLYIDSQLVASAPATGEFETTSGPIWVGAADSSAHHFQGTIEDIRLHDIALAISDLQVNMFTNITNAIPPAPIATPAGGVFPQGPEVSLSAIGGATIRYTINGGTPTTSSPLYATPIVIPQTGGTLRARAFLGTVAGAVLTTTYDVDTTPPTIEAVPFPNVLSNWMSVPVTVSFLCADRWGIAFCPPAVVVDQDGATQIISGTAVDMMGNQSTASVTVGIDRTPPTVTMSDPAGDFTTQLEQVVVTGHVSDVLSGIAAARCNGVAATMATGEVQCAVMLTPGRNSVVLQASDLAGNSTSVGVSITRVGTATTLSLTPATRSMLVSETASLTLRDNFGVQVDGATWESSDNQVVALSAEDPPVLTAVGLGEATVLVTKDGLTAQATIAVTAAIQAGDTRWSVSPKPGYSMGTPLYTNRVDETIPDMFAVETQVWGQASLRALNANGEALWSQESPGIPVMGDSFGGVVAGVLFDVNQGDDFRSYIRLGGDGGVAPWSYHSPGSLLKPAQAIDGTMYAIEFMPGTAGSWDKHAIVLDGRTGQLLHRQPLFKEVDNFISALDGVTLSNGVTCRSLKDEDPPATVGPIVGNDGRGYLLVRRMHRMRWASCLFEPDRRRTTRIADVGIDLVVLSPNGPAQVISLYSQHCEAAQFEPLTPCEGGWDPFQLMPDGLGGMLARWRRTTVIVGSTVTLQYSVTRWDADGGRIDRVVSSSFSMLLSTLGTVYARDSAELRSIDVETWAPNWVRPAGSTPVVALDDGGIVAVDSTTLSFIDGDGQVAAATPVTLSSVSRVLQHGELIGTSSSPQGVIVEAITTEPVPVKAKEYFSPFFDSTGQTAPQTTCQPASWTNRWKQVAAGSTVTYQFDGTWLPDRMFEIQAAFDLWTQANLKSGLNTSFQLVSSGTPNLTLRNLLLPANAQGLSVAAGILDGSNVDAAGTLLNATIAWNTDTNVLSSPMGYRKTALHEIGHAMGLGDLFGFGASSVMNQLGGKDDKAGNLSNVVTACDRDAAWLMQFRQFQ